MSTLIQIVDAQDQVIGHKLRSEVEKEDIYRVAGMWIFNEKGEVLLARRSRTKRHDPGKWGPSVAGTLEEGETYESNILKEAQEELGVTLSEVQATAHIFVELEYAFFAQWFTAKVLSTTKFTLQEEEVEEVMWFQPDQLASLLETSPLEFLPQMRLYLDTIPDPE